MKHLLQPPLGIAIAATVLLGMFALPNMAAAMPVHFGVLGGIGFSKLRGVSSPMVQLEGIKGPCYGLTILFPISPMLSVQPEVLAVTDGISWGKSEWTDTSGNVLGGGEDLHVLDRIQVPVLLRVTSPASLRLRPFAFAGPYAAARLREYDHLTGSIKTTITKELLKSSDFGVTLGGGVQTPLGPGRLELQARYDAGLSDLGDYLGLGQPRTGAVRVLAGYSF